MQSWALAEAAEGDTELARDMLQKATLVQPRSVPCWHAWAALEMTDGNTDKARELYLKALELDPRETFTQSKPSGDPLGMNSLRESTNHQSDECMIV